MKSMLAATLMAALAATTAQAAKKKPAEAPPQRPALQKPIDTANAMAQAQRQAIQSDLAWTGHYNGVITGEANERMIAAIKDFQKDHGGKPTGVLNPQERVTLAEAARKRQGNSGWKIVSDPVTGARLGIPARLVPQQKSDANGTTWSSTTGTIVISLARRKQADATIAKIAAQERKDPARRIEYSAVKPDFFVLSGMQNLKKFYIRGQVKGAEVRILTILYDQATEGTMEPVVIAMSSAFNPFPAGGQEFARKPVEYASGVVVTADGNIVTDRNAIEGCRAVVIPRFGRADTIAEDKDHDLALLRIYGARGLTPLRLAGGEPKPALDVVGIADPQNQAGGDAVSGLKSTATPVGDGGDLALVPPPGTGFSGAAALDADGTFAGIAILKPVEVTGPPAAGATPDQAMLTRADAVRGFLKANNVAISEAGADPKASIVRVICVRR